MDAHIRERYQRQIALNEIGETGQERLAQASVVIVGGGALGSGTAERLVRAGVGHIRLIDPDRVELSNLPRQSLFTETDASTGAFKAEALAVHLRAINSACLIDAQTQSLEAANALDLLDGFDVLIDGTDAMPTRYRLNDAAVKLGLSWVHAGVVGTEGQVLAVCPGQTPCLRCVFPDPPDAGQLPDPAQRGVLGTVVGLACALQATAALRLIVDPEHMPPPRLVTFDVWTGHWRALRLPATPVPECPCCGAKRFDFLEG